MTNVANHSLSEQMLDYFDIVADKSEDKKCDVLGGQSIVEDLGCGCKHVHNILVPNCRPHFEIHFVELCNKHSKDFLESKKGGK